jgi:hypothetical protein
VGGIVKGEKGITAVEAVTVGIRTLRKGLQGIPTSLGSILETSVQKEVLQLGHMAWCMERYPLVTGLLLAVTAGLLYVALYLDYQSIETTK